MQPQRNHWWWFKPKYAAEKRVAAAVIWEYLRRTRFYRELWREHTAALAVVHRAGERQRSAPIENPLIPDFQRLPELRYLCGTLPKIVGTHFADVLRDDLCPDRTWIELSIRQQKLVSQIPDLLPRQSSPGAEASMAVGVAELIRDAKGQLRVGRTAWSGDGLITTGTHKIPALQKLCVETSRVFIFVRFDPAFQTEALERKLDEVLARRLEPKSSRKAKAFRAMAKNEMWDQISKDDSLYPDLWKPDRVAYAPHRKGEDCLIMAELEEPYALCFFPAGFDVATLRGRFHHLMRQENRKKWLPLCVREWRARGVHFVESLGIKRAHQKNPWLGLAALDCGLSTKNPDTTWLCRQWNNERAKLNGERILQKAKPLRSHLLTHLDNCKQSASEKLDELDQSPRSGLPRQLHESRSRPEFPFC